MILIFKASNCLDRGFPKEQLFPYFIMWINGGRGHPSWDSLICGGVTGDQLDPRPFFESLWISSPAAYHSLSCEHTGFSQTSKPTSSHEHHHRNTILDITMFMQVHVLQVCPLHWCGAALNLKTSLLHWGTREMVFVCFAQSSEFICNCSCSFEICNNIFHFKNAWHLPTN